MAQNEPEHTLPVFVQNNSLPAFDKKDFSTAEICSYAEKTTGFNSIIGAQKISGLWRIYPRDKGGRQKLLIQGMTVRGVQVTVKDKKRTTTPMSTTPAPSSPRPRTPRTRQTNVKQTNKTKPSSPTTQPNSTRRAAPHRTVSRCPLQLEAAAHDARTAPTPPVTTR